MVTSKQVASILCAVLGLALASSELFAQASGEVRRGGRLGARPRGQDALGTAREQTALRPTQGGMNPDHFIAAKLALGNMEEIALGNFASQQSQTEQVRRFAQQMVKDHTLMMQKLQPFAPDFVSVSGGPGTAPTTTAGPAAPTESGANIQAGTAQVEVGALAGARVGFDPLKVARQISERSIASSKRELGQKRGAEFDKCYVGMQVVVHLQMLDKLHVLRDYASPKLQQGIDEGIQTTQTHLQHAKQLMASLEQSATRGSASGTPDTSGTRRLRNAGD